MCSSKSSNWVIIFSCFINNFLILGVTRLSPLLFVECMHYYNVDRSAASFPFVLAYMVRNGAGPLVGYLGKQFGLQCITTIGCTLSAVGIGTCYFAKDIVAVTVCWGFIFGLGFGFGTSLLQPILNEIFVDNRSVANGIALAGANLGAIVLPILYEVIFPAYGNAGTFLLVSGLVLHAVPASMLLKNWNKSQVKGSANEPTNHSDCSSNLHIKMENILCPTVDGKIGKGDLELHPNHQLMESCNIPSESIHKNDTILNHEKFASLKVSQQVDMVESLQSETQNLSSGSSLTSIKNLNETRAYKFDSNNTTNEPIHHFGNSKVRTTHISSFRTLKILIDPMFIVIGLHQSLYAFNFVIHLTIFIDLLRDREMNRSYEVYYLTGYTIVNMCGRLCFGLITDGGHMTLVNYFILCYCFIGLMSVVVPWIHGFAIVICVLYLHSLVMGGMLISFPSMTHQYIEPDYRTMALASGLVFYTPLSLATPPIIGYFREDLGSYDGVLYVLTASCFLAAGLVALIPVLDKRKKKRISVESKT